MVYSIVLGLLFIAGVVFFAYVDYNEIDITSPSLK